MHLRNISTGGAAGAIGCTIAQGTACTVLDLLSEPIEARVVECADGILRLDFDRSEAMRRAVEALIASTGAQEKTA